MVIQNFLSVLIIRAEKNIPQYDPLILIIIAEIIPQECIFNTVLYVHSIILQPQNEYHESSINVIVWFLTYAVLPP